MEDQKIENLLNLALDTAPEERVKSQELDVGFDAADQTWEIIVKYSGDLRAALPEGAQAVLLSGGYAIVTVPQRLVDVVAALAQVEFVEKPKRLYFAVDAGRAASCVSPVQAAPFGLSGRGVLVAVIDSGVDYFHPDFRNEDGSSRILALWDQSAEAADAALQSAEAAERAELAETADAAPWGAEAAETAPQSVKTAESASLTEKALGETDFTENADVMQKNPGKTGRKIPGPPAGFLTGVEYTKEDLDAALAAGSRAAGLALVPEQDPTGHGTEVLGIAAGNGRASGGRYRGVAPEADLLVVKLGVPRANGFPRTAELMQAIEYVTRKAGEYGLPAAVNLSFGSGYGSRRGNSLAETYLDMMAGRGRSVIVAGTGNEGNTGGHAAGRVEAGRVSEIEFLINDFETVMNLQLWKNYADEYQVTLIHPNGSQAGPFGPKTGASRYHLGSTTLLVYYGEPSPWQTLQELYLDFIPDGSYIDSGVWRIRLTPQRIVTGEYDLWMPDGRARNDGTRFLTPAADTTMTIPSSASRVIAVGAYDARSNAAASFSGRGWPDAGFYVRPDLAAPGVEVTASAVGGGYVSVSGTSFSAPFVTGAAALLMQWGAQGNDPYLYGAKVRAYLRRGARQLPGYDTWPNNLLGYGALCVRDSLPV